MDVSEKLIERVTRVAMACLDCSPAPCMQLCPQSADVPAVMHTVRRAACEGLPLSRWLLNDDRLEAARIADQICGAYQ